MDGHFFAALALLTVAPTLLGAAGLGRLVPLVFLQMLFGGVLRALANAGWIAAPLLDAPLLQSLRGLGWLGIALLIALTAAESAPAARASRSRQFVVISVGGFWLSCALGAALSWQLAAAHPEWIGPHASPAVFALGIGLALAVTALPVLVAILAEARLLDTPMGKLAANSAMLDDLWLWLGMALLLTLARSGGGTGQLQSLAWLAAYLVVMLVPVRRLLARRLTPERLGARGELLACAALVFLSATATHAIGVHAVFGIFVAGAVLPAGALQAWRAQLLQFTQVLLLPLFFVLTGMQLELSLAEPAVWTLTAVFSAAAIGGKLLLVAAIARGLGLPLRDSLALGSLMQCKGLMEIVAITMLRDAGIIGAQVFSALALTAVLSTALCLPLARAALRGRPRAPVAV